MKKVIVGVAIAALGTVGGGMVLDVVPKPPDLLSNVVGGVWNGGSWVWSALVSSYLLPGWAILGVGIFALLGSVVLIVNLKETLQGADERPLLNYTEDTVDGVVWRWRWVGSSIGDLWCFCPICDAQLVHGQGLATTDFICERCPSDGSLRSLGGRGRIIATIEGGDRQYAYDAAKREILRRIRRGEVGVLKDS